MAERAALHDPFWPPGLPRHLTLPQTNVWYNVEVSATRYPDKPFIIFYDAVITFATFRRQTERIAAYLTHECGIQAGDRVLLYLQNSPQWILAFYGILRANAIVVPVNPMNRTEEIRHCAVDSGASVAFVPQDLLPQVRPLLGPGGLLHLVVATYSDYLPQATDLAVPDFIAAPRHSIEVIDAAAGVVSWEEMMSFSRPPGPLTAGPDDLCVMPYTSGTTGAPKGCMHTHRSVMSTLVGGVNWFARTQDATYLTVLPLFHVTGMAGSMNGPLYLGATIVVLPRWDRDAAATMMQRYRVTIWQSIATMMIDFLSHPKLDDCDISSLQGVRGGGAAMPAAVAEKLKRLTGLDYVEGYGMSETMAATHINPIHRPKLQCLGIPVFDVDARLIDPVTLEEVAVGEIGEIIVNGPQVMKGYWNDPQADSEAFIEVDGKRFLRTGDLARVDDEGYFFMVDRLKRMINASGFKVWPAEVEAMMYRHPDIQEACIIGVRDPRRGETVKALVVLVPGREGSVSEEDIVQWAHARMAPYKSPRIVEFVTSLPKSGSGKVLWRALQDQENARFS
jgi:fatty-acyl-CoA synthase